MTELLQLPRLAKGRVLMAAPQMDEFTGEYEDDTRWEVSTEDLDKAHIATSIVDQTFEGGWRHAPLLDIDIPVTFDQGTYTLRSIRCQGWLEFRTSVVREKDAAVASNLLEAMDLGSLNYNVLTRTVSWWLPEGLLWDLVPSSSEGHHHLYIDANLAEKPYLRLLVALARLRILEPGYVRASIMRGYSAARLPWVKKGSLILHSDVEAALAEQGKKEAVTPLTITTFNAWVMNEVANLDPDPFGQHL